MQFADWTPAYEEHAHIPNVARFYEQAQAFKQLLLSAAPDAEQQKDLDFLLNVGHLFSLIVYGQLILEQAALTGVDENPERPGRARLGDNVLLDHHALIFGPASIGSTVTIDAGAVAACW